MLLNQCLIAALFTNVPKKINHPRKCQRVTSTHKAFREQIKNQEIKNLKKSEIEELLNLAINHSNSQFNTGFYGGG